MGATAQQRQVSATGQCDRSVRQHSSDRSVRQHSATGQCDGTVRQQRQHSSDSTVQQSTATAQCNSTATAQCNSTATAATAVHHVKAVMTSGATGSWEQVHNQEHCIYSVQIPLVSTGR